MHILSAILIRVLPVLLILWLWRLFADWIEDRKERKEQENVEPPERIKTSLLGEFQKYSGASYWCSEIAIPEHEKLSDLCGVKIDLWVKDVQGKPNPDFLLRLTSEIIPALPELVQTVFEREPLLREECLFTTISEDIEDDDERQYTHLFEDVWKAHGGEESFCLYFEYEPGHDSIAYFKGRALVALALDDMYLT
ncbi:MAG: hypothetical protein NT023_17775 [Armatimonadetes bacterium]|nr:hypothetical protein [Armatimonadota bacterium]